MKVVSLILKFFFILSIILLLNFNQGCKDPNDYAPPEDSLLPPPDPPQPVSPIIGFVIMLESVPADTSYVLKWTNIEQAEGYQVEYKIDTFPPLILNCETNVCTIWVDDTTDRLCNHYWRVRASSSAWEWFTEWSEQWWFMLRMRPYGPQHLSPPDGTIFFIDSLPVEIEIQWDIIEDEEFYELRVFEDSLIYEQITVFSNSYTIAIYDTAQFSWQVRAGSSKWQYYSYWSNLWYFRVCYCN